jgi:hypothetical protein
MQGFIIFLFVIVLITAIIYACIQAVKKRRQEFELFARHLKLDFFPKGDNRLGPMLANLEFFKYGDRCQVENLISGQIKLNGKPVSIAIFDYAYTIYTRKRTEIGFGEGGLSISNDDESTRFNQTIFVFYDESIDLPGFSLRPENLMDKVANFAGYQDINFDQFPTFSKTYRLNSNQVNDIRDLFQPNLIKFYEINKVFTEAIGSYLLVCPFDVGHSQAVAIDNKTFSSSRYLQAKELKPFLDLSLKLLNLLEKNMSVVRQ